MHDPIRLFLRPIPSIADVGTSASARPGSVVLALKGPIFPHMQRGAMTRINKRSAPTQLVRTYEQQATELLLTGLNHQQTNVTGQMKQTHEKKQKTGKIQFEAAVENRASSCCLLPVRRLTSFSQPSHLPP